MLFCSSQAAVDKQSALIRGARLRTAGLYEAHGGGVLSSYATNFARRLRMLSVGRQIFAIQPPF